MPERQEQTLDQLSNYRTKINQGLTNYFKSPVAKLGLDLEKLELKAFEKLRQFSLQPGKRLRGALGLFAYEQFAKKNNPSAINLALALELVQNYLLIIDDVMDESVYRRGQLTVHQMLAADKKGTKNHIYRSAEMMAITIALIAQHMAAELLNLVDESSDNIVAASSIFHKNIAATCYGQFDDLRGRFLPILSGSQIIRIYELKSSHYSFINPLQLGAALAGFKDEKIQRQLAEIGLPLGVVFQMQDDVLGLFGDQKATGKSNMDDLKEGKLTLLMLYTLQLASKTDIKKVRTALGNKNLTGAQHRDVQAIVEKCGARAAIEDKAQQYCQLAKQRIVSSQVFKAEGKQFLSELVDYVVSRKA